jgi:hypothetical protein
MGVMLLFLSLLFYFQKKQGKGIGDIASAQGQKVG